MRVRPLVVALCGALVLAGCGSGAPGEARIDVDTSELRELKAEAGVEDCVPGDAEPVDGGLPEVTLPCFGGGEDVALGSLRGPLVVNLWASWCGPCRDEMPVLQRFYAAHGDRVPVLGVDYQDTQPGNAMQLVVDSGVTYPLLADPQATLQGAAPFPGQMGLPIMAFVDEAGQVTVVPGEIESVAGLEDLVDEHLGISL